LKAIKPPEYAGEEDASELDTWTFRMETYFATVPVVADDQKLLLVGLVLKGQAATWWRDVSQKPVEQRP
jgi:hypothetical protein